MWPDRVSIPGPLTYESGALPTALRGPAVCLERCRRKSKSSVVWSQEGLTAPLGRRHKQSLRPYNSRFTDKIIILSFKHIQQLLLLLLTVYYLIDSIVRR